MGTTRDAVKKRIEQLAQRMGVCATHGCRLRCVHEFQWDGTTEQLFEASALAEKMTPGVAQLRFTGLTCPSCRSTLWCERCISPPASPGARELLTPAEQQRYAELSALMHEKAPPLTFAEFLREPSTDPPAPALPAPTPPPEPPENVTNGQMANSNIAPVVAPVPDIQADNIRLNTPEIIDDDDEVDDSTIAELQDMITQLTAQLKARR